MYFSLARTLAIDQQATTWKAFEDFQSHYGKVYDSIDEVKERFAVFRENMRMIAEHNSDSSNNFTMAMNKFSDLTRNEFAAMVSGGFTPTVLTLGDRAGAPSCGEFNSVFQDIPANVDWRDDNAVTSVKNQGQCGSCWSFSAAGALEGAWSISSGTLVDLSEQQLVDCAGLRYGNLGCHGGLMDGAFEYVIENGLCLEHDYPYMSGVTQKSGTCDTSCTSGISMSDCSDVEPNNQLALKTAVATMGPVSVAIEADTRYFQSYSSGVLTAVDCGTTLDHGVLVVGYGEDSGQKYWLVKNSWGEDWGESGYVKIGRDDSSDSVGICGIAAQPSFPIV